MPPMAFDPSDDAARRSRARRQAAAAARMRGRRRGVGLLFLLVAAAIGAAVASNGGGSRAKPAARQTAPTVPAGHSAVRPPATASAGTAATQLAAVRRLGDYGLPLYCGGTARPMVALTFDDGPGPYTSLALRKLRKHRVPATFFIVGRNIARFSPKLLPAENRLEAVGDHTFTHPFLPALPAAGVADELGRTQRLMTQTTGSPVALFRPPYGARTAAIDAEAKRLGMLEVIWSVDSRDSEGADYAQIAANVDSGMRPGAIILMHENRGQTIRAMLQIFPALARKHLQPVTLPELLTADPPSLSQLRAGPRGCGGVSVSRLSG
jgi:peptidoglycan/xylan/chitin deacetylase (PgdA/CDA1 family)